jgi:hypothetical protein
MDDSTFMAVGDDDIVDVAIPESFADAMVENTQNLVVALAKTPSPVLAWGFAHASE